MSDFFNKKLYGMIKRADKTQELSSGINCPLLDYLGKTRTMSVIETNYPKRFKKKKPFFGLRGKNGK